MKTELKVTDQIEKLFASAVLYQYHFYLSRDQADLNDLIFQCQLKFFRPLATLHFMASNSTISQYLRPQDPVFCTSSTGTIYFASNVDSFQEGAMVVKYPTTVMVQNIRAFPRYFCLDKKINLQFSFSDFNFQGRVEDISQHGVRISFHHHLDISELNQREYVQIRSIGEMLLIPTLKAQIAYLQTIENHIIACGLFIENDYPFADIKEFFDL